MVAWRAACCAGEGAAWDVRALRARMRDRERSFMVGDEGMDR